jgi:hypothetical protein
MDSIVLPSTFDASNISYSAPRVLSNGGKSIYISYNGQKLVMQTPEMTVPFGMNKWDNDGKSACKYSLDLSFKGKESREVLNKFFEGLCDLDNKLIEDGLVNSQTWFKKKHSSADVLKELYTPMVKFPKDKNGEITDMYPPTIKLSLPHNGTDFTCDVFGSKKDIVDLNSIETKGAKVSAIIQCMGIWMVGSKYGVSWKVIQMKVTPRATIKGYAFKEIEETSKDIDDEEEDNDNDVSSVNEKEILDNAVMSDGGDDDDIIESDDDDLDAKPSTLKKPITKK